MVRAEGHDGTQRLITAITGAAAWTAVAAVLFIVGFLIYSCLPLFRSGEIINTLTGPWRPFHAHPQFGIGPMIVGSLALSFFALILAVPLSIGLCSFIHGPARRGHARFLLAIVHLITGIPTVIYGFVSVLLLVPLLRNGFGGGSGYSLLAAGLTLAFLIIPTITLLLHIHLQQIAPQTRLVCLSLGMTSTQALRHVLLPMTRRGLLTAAVLGLCRALGDTMVALMVAGNAAQYPDSLLDAIRTLTAHIALILATDSFSPEYRSLAAAGLLLFFLTAGSSLFVRRLTRLPGQGGI